MGATPGYDRICALSGWVAGDDLALGVAVGLVPALSSRGTSAMASALVAGSVAAEPAR